MRIRQLVYTSTERFEFDGLALLALMNRARQRNRAMDITGVLLYANGIFVQCLEGAPDDVDLLYARIGKDHRHDRIVLLQSIDTDWRHFRRWAMGCARLPEFKAMQLVRAQWESDLAAMDGGSQYSPGFMLMKSLWETYKDYGFVDQTEDPSPLPVA